MSNDNEIKMPNFMVDMAFKDYVHILSNTQAGKLFKLLFEYADDKQVDEEKLDSTVRLALNAFKPSIDKGRKSYISKVMNGRKGGAPKGNKNAKKQPKFNRNQAKISENNLNQTKTTNKSKVSPTENTLQAFSAGSPEGRSAPKPEYRELREFFENQFGYDDAYFCDEFSDSIDDWQNWEEKMISYARKTERCR